MKSSYWVFLPITILLLSLVILYPNFAVRELELHINPTVLSLNDAEKKLFWINSREMEIRIQHAKFFKCRTDPALGIPKDNYFIVTGRFITSAKINQISQENINLFIESKIRSDQLK